MDKIKRFITCHVPVYACNFRCSYCYLPQKGHAYTGKKEKLPYSIEFIAKCFSKERLGGACHLNFCAPGETLLHDEIVPLVKALDAEGHFCSIITNGILSKRFDEIVSSYTEEEKSRLFVKFSFHWMQLKEKNLFEIFVENVNKIKNAGISFTVEITPHDELVPYISEIKEFSMKNFGALPHITVARNEGTKDIALLTKYSREEYRNIWSQFDSTLFDFKFSAFGVKRNEFCRAGELTLNLDLGSGDYSQCFCGAYLGNIYDLSKPMNFRPIGKCRLPHCFNAHGYISLGAIQKLDDGTKIPAYAEERDRLCADGSHWLTPAYREFVSYSAQENSPEIPCEEQKHLIASSGMYIFFSKIRHLPIRIKRKLFRKK